MRIQHNIMAMNAYRNYNTNTSALAKNLEKLASGYKINRAGDDAAGLAISEKMRAQITGLEAAQKNVKDGISLVKTAEGAMQEVQDMLNRMDYLATQSANGTYDNEVDRLNLQKEVNALKEEINRIADSSNFNGIKLLDGSLAGTEPAGAVELSSWSDAAVGTEITLVGDGTPAKTAQNGVFELDLTNAKWTVDDTNAGGQIEVTIAGQTFTMTTQATSITGDDVAKEFIENSGLVDSSGKITIDGKEFKVTNDGGKLTFTGTDTKELEGQVDLTFEATATGMRADISQPGNANAGSSTTDPNAGNQAWSQAFTMLEEPIDAATQLAGQMKLDLNTLNIQDGTTIKIGDETYTFAVGKESKFANKQGTVDLTDMVEGQLTTANLATAALRLTALANNNKSAYIEADGTGTELYITEKIGGLDRDTWDVTGVDYEDGKDATWQNKAGEGFVRYGLADPSQLEDKTTSKGGLALQIGDTSDEYNRMSVIIGDMHTTGMGIDGVDIGTPEGAAAAIQTIRDAINYVSGIRGDLGAVQNRLEHTANNLSVMAENIQDAESTIRDTDVAEEMMAYTKNNILVQSAQAMLAQANAVPQGVLQLLG